MGEVSLEKGMVDHQFTNQSVTFFDALLSYRTHSTVTDFARLRGWSTSVPLMSAMW